jgi:hypothetical protein
MMCTWERLGRRTDIISAISVATTARMGEFADLISQDKRGSVGVEPHGQVYAAIAVFDY